MPAYPSANLFHSPLNHAIYLNGDCEFILATYQIEIVAAVDNWRKMLDNAKQRLGDDDYKA